MKIFNVTIIFLLILNSKVLSGEISGVPRIIDGDTIKIVNKSIRFHGIDTPEKKQMCNKNSKIYSSLCGRTWITWKMVYGNTKGSLLKLDTNDDV